jgi:hypothetical protein
VTVGGVTVGAGEAAGTLGVLTLGGFGVLGTVTLGAPGVLPAGTVAVGVETDGTVGTSGVDGKVGVSGTETVGVTTAGVTDGGVTFGVETAWLPFCAGFGFTVSPGAAAPPAGVVPGPDCAAADPPDEACCCWPPVPTLVWPVGSTAGAAEVVAPAPDPTPFLAGLPPVAAAPPATAAGTAPFPEDAEAGAGLLDGAPSFATDGPLAGAGLPLDGQTASWSLVARGVATTAIAATTATAAAVALTAEAPAKSPFAHESAGPRFNAPSTRRHGVSRFRSSSSRA